MHALRVLAGVGLLLAGAALLPACPDSQDDDTAADDTAETGDGLPTGDALVSGSSYRTWDTCPPTSDFVGTFCLVLAGTCEDVPGAVASAEVPDADFGNAKSDVVEWEIAQVPDGTWQLWGFLDDDATGCTEPTEGDLASDCQEVVVTAGADVTSLVLELVTKCPAGG